MVLKQKETLRSKCTSSFRLSCLSEGARLHFFLVSPLILPAPVTGLRKSAKFSDPAAATILRSVHREQPAMYFPVANLFFTRDMR